METIVRTLASTYAALTPDRGAANALLRAAGAIGRRVAAYRAAVSSRSRLASMPDYLLRDIGISRHEIAPTSRFGEPPAIACAYLRGACDKLA